MAQNNEAPTGMTTARLVPYSQRWHRAKIILRCLIICFCALAIGLSFLSNVFATAMGPVIIADVAWIIAEFIALCIRRSKKRGIHPIAHLVLDTCFPIAYFYVVVSYGRDIGIAGERYRNKVAEAFVIIFLLVLVILHSVLFVRSCMEVHQRRVTKKEPRPMYYIPGRGSPFVANREPLEAATDNMPAATPSSVSMSSLPVKEEQKVAGQHAQLGDDRV